MGGQMFSKSLRGVMKLASWAPKDCCSAGHHGYAFHHPDRAGEAVHGHTRLPVTEHVELSPAAG